MKTAATVFLIIAAVLAFCAGAFAAPPAAGQVEVRVFTAQGMVSYWITPENSKALGFDGTGVPSMLSVSGSGGSTTFAALTDVSLTAIATGDFLKWNGSDWVNRTAANMRTDLGLVIGTNVQAYDADLTTYAGITPSANVQSLLGAADYSAMRTQLGLGAAALLGTSSGGNGTADNGKVLIFDTGGHFHATTSISVNNTSATIVCQLRPDTLLLNSTGSGSHTLGGAATGARTHTLPDASGTLVHAATTLSGYGITDAQPLATQLTNFAGLANAAGVLTNNGSGTLSYTGTSTGGNGTGDSGKVVIFNANGGISLGKNDQTNTPLTIAISSGYGTVVTVEDFIGFGHYVELKGSDSVGFHAHVPGSSTGNHQGFTADMSGGTGINYGYQATVPSNGLVFLGSEYVNPLTSPRIAITATGDIHRYLNGTSFTAGTDKTILTFANPSGTKTITFPATTGTAVVTSSGAVALTTDTTGNYVADVAGTSNEITSTHTPGEGSTATLSLPATIDLGGKTSFEIPNGAAPTVDAFGEIAGDNDLWAASRGAPVFFDGTASTALVNVLVSDAPSNGQVPKWNTGGTITWEADNSGGTISGTDTQVMFFDGTDTPAGDAGMTYNKTTNVLTATGFVGALTGNASTVTTNANMTGDVTSSGSNATTLAAISGSGPLLAENASIRLDPAGSADGKYSGTTVTGTAGATLAFGDVVVLDVTDSRWELADANSAAAADGDARAMLGICVLAAASDGSATTILLHGIVRADTAFPTFTIGAPVYVSETAGDATSTQPTTADVLIRVIGHALTADEMFFNPDNSWITHL